MFINSIRVQVLCRNAVLCCARHSLQGSSLLPRVQFQRRLQAFYYDSCVATCCSSDSVLELVGGIAFEPFKWNKVIRVLATSDNEGPKEAMRVFLFMRRWGVRPNEHTFPFLFKACASFSGLNEGRQVHGDVVKRGDVYFNVYVHNSLIHFYGSCKKILEAYKLFDEMPYRNVVSWNSIISATVECCWFSDGVELFVEMRSSETEPDETTMVVVLSACSALGCLNRGKWVHSQVIRRGLVVNCQLGTALVDMYGKSGDVEYANSVFSRMMCRNVWTWSAMILAFAQHGFAISALDLFHKMRNAAVKPSDVTFLGVLCACSHAGLVEDVLHYFNEMVQVHRIKPQMTHLCTVVDTLGRSGRLKEAYAFVMSMPVKADGIVWRALLSACNIHDINDDMGIREKVREELVEMEPRGCGNLVMLANNYAEVGLWEKATDLRNGIRDRGLKKIAGESCIELAGSMFRFFSGDNTHSAADEVFSILDTLSLHARTMQF